MHDFIDWLDGKKTHFVAIGLAAVSVAQAMHWIDDTTAATVTKFLMAVGAVTIRLAIKKAQDAASKGL